MPRSAATASFGAALALLLAPFAAAQVPPSPHPIQDNSFLVEEAYNQDPGVVQTIQTFTRLSGPGTGSTP